MRKETLIHDHPHRSNGLKRSRSIQLAPLVALLIAVLGLAVTACGASAPGRPSRLRWLCAPREQPYRAQVVVFVAPLAVSPLRIQSHRAIHQQSGATRYQSAVKLGLSYAPPGFLRLLERLEPELSPHAAARIGSPASDGILLRADASLFFLTEARADA